MTPASQKFKNAFLIFFGWFFGITFMFTAIGGMVNGNVIPALIIFLGSSLFIPSIRQWVIKKLNHKVTSKALVIGGVISTVVAFAMLSPQEPTTNSPQTTNVSQTVPQAATQALSQAKPISVKAEPISSSPTSPPQATAPIALNTQMQGDISCKVVGISDGDTLTCLTNDKSQIKVRLNQIDAPEKSQAFGTAAKQALSGYVFGKTVGLKTNGTDKYGRTIAEVFVGDKNINKAMVADGYAWAYREYMTDNDYSDLETSARSNTKGLWSEPDPIYPSDFRRGKRGEQAAPVQTQTITQQVEQKAVADSGSSCGSKRYCKQMATCAEARHYLNDCGVSRLDRDGDGVPCESLCN